MFLVQLRSFCKAPTKSQTFQMLKNGMLTSIRSEYNKTEYDYDERGYGDIFHEEKFYHAYFDFATYCRMKGETPWSTLTKLEREVFVNKLKTSLKSINKQVIDWSVYNGGFYYTSLRKVRSALVFLEEDFISREKELSTSVDWRLLKNEGSYHVDEALITMFEDFSYKDVDLRAVPYSHNWWNHGKFTFIDSEKRFGDSIEKGNSDPILPMLEVLESERRPINVKNIDWVAILPKGYMYIIDEMFQRHLKMRSLGIHPVSTFVYKYHMERGYVQTFRHLDTLVAYACDHPEEISPLVVRSAIQFMEEEVFPFIDRAKPIWHEFLTGSGMVRLNKLLLNHWNVPTKYDNLETVPSNHIWWPDRNRKNPSKPVHISVAFDEYRERMLCYLQNLVESGEDTTIENTHIFNRNFVNYVRMCLKHGQGFFEMLGDQGEMEFRLYFPRFLDRLKFTMRSLDFRTTDLYSLRCLRSTIEFLKYQQMENDEFQKFIRGDELKELDNVLKEKLEKDSYFPKLLGQSNENAISRRITRIRLLEGLPKSHNWWTKGDFKRIDN